MIDSAMDTATRQLSAVAPNLEPKTLGESIRRHAAASPEAVAIVSSAYEPLRYGQLVEQFNHFDTTLRNCGFGRGSRIGIALRDAPKAALTIASVSCSGVAVPLDLNLTFVEIESRIKLL